MGARRGQSGQRVSYDPFDVHLWHPELAALGQRSTDLAFPKAQPTQGGERFGLHLHSTRFRRPPVVAAVGVAESNTRRDAAGDDELTAMCRAMVRAAKRSQIIGIVPATLRTQRNVMNVEKLRIATTRDDAPLMIAAPHGSARRR
ncbi:MAG TPA: hypothetical protein VH062_23600 [Polyangiaceae bacterium]|nr:hypothetical protein [Polyangiaceae bacterium]